MKAAVQSKYGSPDAITIEDLPKPVPAANEVLIRVHAATVGIVDTLARKGEPAYARVVFGLRRDGRGDRGPGHQVQARRPGLRNLGPELRRARRVPLPARDGGACS